MYRSSVRTRSVRGGVPRSAGTQPGRSGTRLGLGDAALVSSPRPREVGPNRKLARSGDDPLAKKRRDEGVPNFAEAAERVLEQQRGGWRGR